MKTITEIVGEELFDTDVIIDIKHSLIDALEEREKQLNSITLDTQVDENTFPAFNVQIWVGLRAGYTNKVFNITDVEKLCDDFVNEVKDCVTITPTQFRYVDGYEPGVIVGYINYPRFPRTPEEIMGRSLQLAKILMYGLEQNRVTVTSPMNSYMLNNEKQYG